MNKNHTQTCYIISINHEQLITYNESQWSSVTWSVVGCRTSCHLNIKESRTTNQPRWCENVVYVSCLYEEIGDSLRVGICSMTRLLMSPSVCLTASLSSTDSQKNSVRDDVNTHTHTHTHHNSSNGQILSAFHHTCTDWERPVRTLFTACVNGILFKVCVGGRKHFTVCAGEIFDAFFPPLPEDRRGVKRSSSPRDQMMLSIYLCCLTPLSANYTMLGGTKMFYRRRHRRCTYSQNK